MKILRLSLLTLFTLYSLLFTLAPSSLAASTPPFPPFSVEGNPVEDYYFSEIFPLFRYVRPRALKIYENRDRNRNYEPYELRKPEGDRRDQVCSIDAETGELIDTCDGGEIDVYFKDGGGVAYTHNSGGGSCSAKRNILITSGEITGKCSYLKRPSIDNKVKGTDFSGETLPYPKLQNESYAYSYQGTSNTITWGSQYLNSDFCEVAVRKALVVVRAKLTKSLVAQTGEWPLGWVDWGYQVNIDHDLNPDTPTSGTKTLEQIEASLPGGIAAGAKGLSETLDDMYMNPGNYAILAGMGEAKAGICDEIKKGRGTISKVGTDTNAETWYIDLMSVPMYSPSYRQGYVRPSICKWNLCCPGLRCPLPDFLLIGTRRGLYYDTSISQAFGAALDELFMSYPLDQAMKIFINLSANNPLIRFASSTSPGAIPSRIHERLSAELKGTCVDYVPWGNWNAFGTHIDYLKPGNFLGPNNTCPDYELAPERTKHLGGSYPQSNLSWLLNLIWGEEVDEAEPDKKHLITIPDAMGQSITEIQQHFYDTRDTLTELESIKEFNEDLSSTVDDEAEKLYSDKPPRMPLRHLGLYACDDEMFSAQTSTTIEAYALGTRIGCDEVAEVPEGKCDGQLFAKLIEGSGYDQTSAKGESYFSTYIEGNLTPELMNTYAEAEAQTGVPCEILAGIHFVEAANNPEGSLVSGRRLGTPEPDAGGKVFKSLIDTAIYAGEHLKGKVGGSIDDAQTAITALSRYNGGGNSNCQLGYPYPIPYGGCPRAFEGEDDPYPTSFLDNKHDNMYLLYCADRTACVPQVFERPGSFTVALNVYNSITKDGYENTELPEEQENPAPAPTTTPGGNSGSFGFFPRSCGEGTLSTALGCIPYTRDAFVAALLSFIVGIAGAIALVMMLVATFQIMTAGDNAEQLAKGKELFTAAVIGLLFLIFSVSLLRIIAGDIIKLPGF